MSEDDGESPLQRLPQTLPMPTKSFKSAQSDRRATATAKSEKPDSLPDEPSQEEESGCDNL